MADAKPLRLLAEDADDLKILSAAVQDSVAKAGGFKFDGRRRRFSLELNRFRWEGRTQKQRVRAILAFDGVLAVKARGITRYDPEIVISLLSISFAPDDEPPGGTVTLLLAGDGEVQLSVEAIDATLLDSDYVWPTRHEPGHEQRKR
ncbi:MAG: DUF2948 family protein [Pseudomonadota bacterium]